MNVEIRYFTRSGNSKKLAEAISKELSVSAKDVSVSLGEKADILFLCSSYYAFDLDDNVKKFISDNKDNIGKIVCVGTSAMMKSMKKPMHKVADSLGIPVADEEFHCKGSFGPFNKGRPNEDDLSKLSAFAKKLAE